MRNAIARVVHGGCTATECARALGGRLPALPEVRVAQLPALLERACAVVAARTGHVAALAIQTCVGAAHDARDVGVWLVVSDLTAGLDVSFPLLRNPTVAKASSSVSSMALNAARSEILCSQPAPDDEQIALHPQSINIFPGGICRS